MEREAEEKARREREASEAKLKAEAAAKADADAAKGQSVLQSVSHFGGRVPRAVCVVVDSFGEEDCCWLVYCLSAARPHQCG